MGEANLSCRHCGEPIELREDVLLYLGRREYFHPELVDGAIDGKNRAGTYCDSDCEQEAEPEPPRCDQTITVKLPYDSCPETTRLQCLLPEDHECGHEYEHIRGAQYPREAWGEQA